MALREAALPKGAPLSAGARQGPIDQLAQLQGACENIAAAPGAALLLVERFDAPEFRRVAEKEARTRLDALVTDDVRVWCKPTTKVAYGKPYREILQVAEKEKADLIVIGVRGRNQLDLTVFGSTTNQVVRRASCPVLTLNMATT